AVFDIVSTGLGLFALELNEELPGLMARGDERQGTSDKNGQQNEIDAQHHASGPSVRSATRMMALRARGLAALSAAPARTALPMSRRGGVGKSAVAMGSRAIRASPPKGTLCRRRNSFTMRSSSE